MRRQAMSAIACGLLVLAGCAGSDASTGATVETVGTDASPASAEAGTSSPATNNAGAEQTTAATSPGSTTATSSQAAATDDTGSVPEQCSSDGAATELSPLPGDAPEVAVEPAFANSPLPSVSLRRVNCGPTFVNMKNEAPTDKPVLYWFWAPF